MVKRIDYDSFGNIINDSDATFEIPFGFAGGLHDRDTGLVRFGFRDYDPDIGRWTAKDPIGFWGGDVDLYGYVLNDPVNWVDPWGLYTWPVIGPFPIFPISPGFKFGAPRGHGPHLGFDIPAPIGTPVVAIESGRVLFAGWVGGLEGYIVRYVTKSGLEVQVYHLSAVNVQTRACIYEGQKIGEVGITGEGVSGPHLHIQIKPPGGTWVDPWPIIIDAGLYWNIG